MCLLPSYIKTAYSSLCLSRERDRIYVLKQDTICDTEQDVWNDLLEYKIASIYVSAYNISGDVMKDKGYNTFLANRGL